jgi:hypothetical protein
MLQPTLLMLQILLMRPTLRMLPLPLLRRPRPHLHRHVAAACGEWEDWDFLCTVGEARYGPRTEAVVLVAVLSAWF